MRNLSEEKETEFKKLEREVAVIVGMKMQGKLNFNI